MNDKRDGGSISATQSLSLVAFTLNMAVSLNKPQNSGATQLHAEERELFFNPWTACMFAVVLALAANVLWFAYDNRVPSTDEAGHILNAMQYKDLLRHPHVLKLDWLHQFLSINPFYPPAVYIYDGFLKLVLGGGRWVDTFALLSYVALLTATTFGIAWKISKCSGVALIAALLVNCYPQISSLSHVYMLDLPLTATVTAGVFALLCWETNPSWKRTIATGLVLMVACMTKQLGAAYLIPPCLYLLIVRKEREKLIAMGAIVSAVLLPWLLVNIQWIRTYAQENAASMQGASQAPLTVFADYCVGLGYSLSALLGVAFLAALVLLKKSEHRSMLLIYSSAIGGLLLTSLLSCTFPLDRYAAPVLIICAVVTACGARRLYQMNRVAGVVVLASVGFLTALQYLSFNYSPYPITQRWLSAVSENMHVKLREFRGARILKSTPSDNVAWGQAWVVDTIAQHDRNLPVWLNVLPSHGIYNPHSFELIAREKNCLLRPTTSRLWTIMGDKVEFLPETALYYHWYLIKTGFQGNQFFDGKSKLAYDKLIQFVRESGKFHCVAQRTLPDNSSLSLYRQK